MVQAYSQTIFNGQKPVFDGRKNMSSRNPFPIGRDKVDLEVTLPGDGSDRVFKVSIKWQAQISRFHLDDALEGRSQNRPFDAIQALDAVMRCHLPSINQI